MQNDSQFSLELSRAEAVKSGASFEPVFRFASHDELLDQLAHGAQFNPGIQVVEGPADSGKSTLADSLCRDRLTTCEHLAEIQVEPGEAPQSTLAKVAVSLGVGVGGARSAGELMSALRHFSQSLHAQSQVGILVVDDAQHLDQQTIAALLSLLQGSGESGFGLHFVLWSEPGLTERLDALQLVDVPVHDFAVPLLTPSDVQAVVKELAAASSPGASATAFSGPPLNVQQLWTESEGRVGRLKSLIREKLVNDQAADQANIPTADQPDQTDRPANLNAPANLLGLPVLHVAALALLVAVLIGALFAWDPTSGTPDSAPGSGNAADSESSSVAVMGRGNAPSPAHTDTAPEQAILPEPGEPGRASDTASPASAGSSEEGQALIEDFSLEPVIADRELRQALYGKASPTADTAPVSAAESAEQETAHAEAGTAPVLNSAPKSPHQPQVDVTPEPVAEDIAPISSDVKKLLSFAPDSYSLQIMAATTRNSLEDFKAEQPNASELYLYQTERQGKQWFLLLFGNFPSRAAANDAIERLPAVQKTAGPWPRRLENVHREIEAFRGR